jgi:hypothetical protein
VGVVAAVIARFRRWLGSAPARLNGSHVSPQSEHVTTLSSRARFSANDDLLLRMARARDELGPDVQPRADRKLIVETDTFVKPLDYGELGVIE